MLITALLQFWPGSHQEPHNKGGSQDLAHWSFSQTCIYGIYGISDQNCGLISSYLNDNRLYMVLDGKAHKSALLILVSLKHHAWSISYLIYINLTPDAAIFEIMISAYGTTVYCKCDQDYDTTDTYDQVYAISAYGTTAYCRCDQTA